MSEKIIQFPGAKQAEEAPPPVPGKPPILTASQQKAINCILSGMPFVFVGIKPTDSGADFFTALHGDDTALRNAHDHLPAVISRLYEREGVL